MRCFFRFGLRFVLAIAGCGFAHARDKWLYSQSDHFELLSSASEWESRKMLGDLEQFRASFLATIHLHAARDPRATVILFNSDREFGAFKPLYNGKPVEAAGFFSGATDEVVISLVAGLRPEDTREIIFHEYVHLLLHSRDLPVPPWLNEGLAELYSTFEIEKGVVRFGQPKPRHVRLLTETTLMHFGELFGVGPTSHTYNDGPERGLFYAESWGLVHFWLCGEDQSYRPRLIQFMILLDQPGAMPERCFKEAFGMGYEEMERKFERYLHSGTFLVRGAKVLLPDYEKKLVFRPATDLERDVALENLRYRLRHTADSEYKLLQIAEREPTSARPYEVLAAIAMYDRETRMALDRWSKAGALGTTNAFVYLQLAKDIVRQILNGVSLDYRIPENECTQLRGWLDRAIELSPDYWEAYETLAVVEAFAAKPRAPVLQKIQTVIKQLRDPQRVLVSLAVIRWRINDLTTSEAILNLLEKRPTGASSEKMLAGKLRKRILADRAKALAADPQTGTASSAAGGDVGIAK